MASSEISHRLPMPYQRCRSGELLMPADDKDAFPRPLEYERTRLVMTSTLQPLDSSLASFPLMAKTRRRI